VPDDREGKPEDTSTELHERHQRNEAQLHEKSQGHAERILPMETRRLGQNGPLITRFGLGMAALGRPAYINLRHGEDFSEGRSVEAMEEHSCRVLDRALTGGIRYFDAARSYGRAEQFLRSWFDRRGLRPEDLVVSSKWGYRYTGDWQVDGRVQEVKDQSEAMLKTQVVESISILGPYLRLYQIHSATLETGVLDDRRVLEELGRLREKGLLLGVTTTGPKQLETIRRAIAIRFDGEPLFSSIQATWNLLERRAEPGLREAHEAGFTVLVKEALANGRLTLNGNEGTDGPLRTVADRLHASPDTVALAFVMKETWADVILLGAVTIEQLESNLRAPEVHFGPEELEILNALRSPAEEYWTSRARLAWN
jgi:aryl-alcohol dehydrogenase-like predicted oxidoreductase